MREMADKKIPVIVIVGPTASGKTLLAIETAKLVNGEIISADSMQIYRGMDIGTAKATREEQASARHHVIDVAEPDQYFSVADFVELADCAISDIISRGKTPIIAGGTGFYIDALIDRYEFPPQDTAEMKIRSELELLSTEDLRKELFMVDKVSAERLHENDRHRIVRALEVFHLSGKALSEFDHKANMANSPYSPLFYGVGCDRAVLYARITKRVQQMMEEGLYEEVLALHKKGYGHDSPAMLGISYRQMLGYIRGEYDIEEAIELTVRDSRRYAKRQFTWFNKNKRINWLNLVESEDAKGLAENIVIDYNNISK